jgi:lysophospholipase L1-like esterase
MDYVASPLRDDLSTTMHPRLITLWLGANDAALPDGPCGGQYVPLATYKSNLHALIKLFKDKAPQAELLLITPPPVDDNVRRVVFGGEKLDRSNAAAHEYARACVQVAREANVQVLDLYTLFTTMRPGEQWKSLLVDGLHLSSEGNQLMEQLLTDLIRTKFSALERQLQHTEFPLWTSRQRSEKVVAEMSGHHVMTMRASETEAKRASHQGMAVRRATAIDSIVQRQEHRQLSDAWTTSLLSALLVCGLFMGFVIRRVGRHHKPTRTETHEDVRVKQQHTEDEKQDRVNLEASIGSLNA